MRALPLFLVGPLLVACASYRFEPDKPLQSASQNVGLDLRALRFGWSRGLVYWTHSKREHAVARAWFADKTSAPCAGGVPATQLLVDGESTNVIPAGVHEVEIGLPRNVVVDDVFQPRAFAYRNADRTFSDFDHDSVVDLKTQEGLCLRATAIDRAVPMTAASRQLVVGAVGGQIGGDDGNLRGLLGVQLGAGGWVGSWLLTGTVGFGGAFCDRQICGGQYDDTRVGAAFPVTLDARWTPGPRVAHHRMNLALLGARYTAVWASLPTATSTRTVLGHVVQAAIGWGSGAHPLGPFTHGERGTPQELSALLGVVISPDLPSPVAFMGGVEFRFFVPR
jgi:hypothetical protein